MVSQPIPLSLTDASGADRGLICGYQVFAEGPPREVPPDRMLEALRSASGVTWLHFNLSDGRARRWLLSDALVPAALREVLQEHDENHRIEAVEGGILLVISDFTYEDAGDPAEVAALWCFAGHGQLITARLHALRSPDELRHGLRTGSTAASGVGLLAQLLDIRNATLRRLADSMIAQLDRVEDEILAGNIKQQREHLGRTRRTCARLRRQFAPERADLGKFLHRHGSVLEQRDREALQESTDTLGYTIEEVAELYERAKLLQEELASRLAESTSRNLYVLSVLTAILLPMTLVTGIFGMNVAGMPGLHDAGAFWRVMLLIIGSGAATLAALVWRRLL